MGRRLNGLVLALAAAVALQYAFCPSDDKEAPTEKEVPASLLGSLDALFEPGYSKVCSENLPPQPPLPAPDKIEELASYLTAQGFDVDGKDLVTVCRVMYNEGAGVTDPQSDLAIAATIINRYNFDQEHSTNRFGGENGLVGVVTRSGQYNGYDQNPEDFSPESMYREDGTLQLSPPRLSTTRERERMAELATALVDIATGKKEDPTNGATHYKRDYVDQTWQGDIFTVIMGVATCRLDYETEIGRHEFFGLDCQ